MAEKFSAQTQRTPSFFDDNTYFPGIKTSEPDASADFIAKYNDLKIGNFTTGSVMFAGSDGLLSEDNTELFWDDTFKYLGIGTDVPSQKLHIQGGGFLAETDINENQVSWRDSRFGVSINLADPDVLIGEDDYRALVRIGQRSYLYSAHTGTNVGFGLISTNGKFYLNNNSNAGGNSELIFGTEAGSTYGVIKQVDQLFGPEFRQLRLYSGGNETADPFEFFSKDSGGSYLKRFEIGNYEDDTDIQAYNNRSFGLGNVTDDVAASNTFVLSNGSTASTPNDSVSIFSKDLSAGNTMLALRTEGTPLGVGTPTQDTTIALEINGTTYYLLASTSAT